MLRLDKIVSRLSSGNIGNIKNRVENGIDKIRGYVEKGVDRTREYLETANEYITNTINEVEQGIKNLGNEIRKKVETAKEVIPYSLINTLIFSNRWGQLGYYGAIAFVFYQMSQGNSGGWYSKIFPIIVGAISGGLGLIGGIFLGDHFLSNHYHESSIDLQQQVQYLKNEVQELQQQELNLQNEVQNLEQQVQCLGNQDQQLQQQVQYLQNQEQYVENQLQYLQNRVQYLGNEVQYLQNQNQGLEQQVQYLQNQVQNLESLLQSLESSYQNAEQQLQNIYTLTKILFGNNNPSDITVIQAKSVTVENGTAYVYGTVSSSGANVTLEIPVNYVENGNVNIQEFVNDVQQYGWNPYILIDRADLQYMNLLNNQNGTYVISIQPNQPVNIGVAASSVDGSTLNNVLNQLTKYDIVIQDGSTVYNSPNALWGYTSGSSVIVDFSNSYQYNLAENMINIADQIINSPGNQNPTSEGIIYTYSIFQGSLTINTNQGYPQYNVGQTYIPLIVSQSGQGNTIINEVSS